MPLFATDVNGIKWRINQEGEVNHWPKTLDCKEVDQETLEINQQHKGFIFSDKIVVVQNIPQ